jgi:hypothetical protein
VSEESPTRARRQESDSDSEVSVDGRSLELASSHSSDDDESSNRRQHRDVGKLNSTTDMLWNSWVVASREEQLMEPQNYSCTDIASIIWSIIQIPYLPEYKLHPPRLMILKWNKYFRCLHRYMQHSQQLRVNKFYVAPCSYIYYLKTKSFNFYHIP